MNYKLLSSEGSVLFEGFSEDLFEELHKFKRKTFGDVFDKEFRSSNLRCYLKNMINKGDEIIIKIEK